jgi:hypothetical protein
MKKSLSALAVAVVILGASGTAKAQAPVYGQPYQVPACHQGACVGTPVSFGGYNYVINGGGTMLLSSPPATCNTQPVATSYFVTQPVGFYGYGYGYRHHGYHTRWASSCGYGYGRYRHCR